MPSKEQKLPCEPVMQMQEAEVEKPIMQMQKAMV